jgi:hypothetical protein
MMQSVLELGAQMVKASKQASKQAAEGTSAQVDWDDLLLWLRRRVRAQRFVTPSMHAQVCFACRCFGRRYALT